MKIFFLDRENADETSLKQPLFVAEHKSSETENDNATPIIESVEEGMKILFGWYII